MSKILVVLIVLALLFFFFLRFSINGKADSKAAVENVKLGADFLAANRSAEGVITTSSGLQYQLLKSGTGTAHPTASDRVKVHYHGTLLNGEVFDSSVDRGEPIEFGLNQVIKGWTEGLQLMVVGDKARLFIPSDLAYGDRATGSIAAGSTLIFDVELLGVNE